ncbi:unnamed protein product [Caenorhabditis brenneri]
MNFTENLTNCPTCLPPIDCELQFAHFDWFLMLTSVSVTFTLMIFIHVCYKQCTVEDLSENVDPYKMNVVIASRYFRSLYENVMKHREELKIEGESEPGEDFCRYFIDLYERDSVVSGALGNGRIVKEHEIFQRIKSPLIMHSRVKLKDHKGQFHDDYVHANYIDYPSGLKLIMTPGPQAKDKHYKMSDIERFWWIANQEGADRVVMLCGFEERYNGTQCDEYYPDNVLETLKYRYLTVTCVEKRHVEEEDPITYRKLAVKFVGEPKFYVSHWEYTGWTEYGHPDKLDRILELLKNVRTSWNPVMVHCSDGIGRTGCFGYIEMAFQFLKRDGQIEFGEVLDLIRTKRAGLIVSPKQYATCAALLGWYIVIENSCRFLDDDDKPYYDFLMEGYQYWDTVKDKVLEMKEIERKKLEKKLRKSEKSKKAANKRGVSVKKEPVKKEEPVKKVEIVKKEEPKKEAKIEEAKKEKSKKKKVKSKK